LDVDPDDCEFVALAEQIKGFLWTGDKVLSSGLARKGWKKCKTTIELYQALIRK
jgi:predicted nucleic acid-binding protein